jgi:hypothetical protein
MNAQQAIRLFYLTGNAGRSAQPNRQVPEFKAVPLMQKEAPASGRRSLSSKLGSYLR